MNDTFHLFEWSEQSLLNDPAVLAYSEMKLGGSAAVETFAQSLATLLRSIEGSFSLWPPILLTWIPTFVSESGIAFVASRISTLSGYPLLAAGKMTFTYHYQGTGHDERRERLIPRLFYTDDTIDITGATIVVFDDALVSGAMMRQMVQEIHRRQARVVRQLVITKLQLLDPVRELEFDCALYRRNGAAGVCRLVADRHYKATGFLLTLLDLICDLDAKKIVAHLSPENVAVLLRMLAQFAQQSPLDVARLTNLIRQSNVKQR